MKTWVGWDGWRDGGWDGLRDGERDCERDGERNLMSKDIYNMIHF